MSWYCLPAEIRCIILQNLVEDGGKLANFARVSREWQRKIEQHTFARIRLTQSRLAEFDAMTSRNRALVHCLWLCIVAALQNLFSVLSTWEPNSNLTLDINVYSPSDSEHWFQHLTFEPDIVYSRGGDDQTGEQVGKAIAIDYPHDWETSPLGLISPEYAVERLFGEIMTLGPFDNDEREDEWWQRLPLIPAVTRVLIRQQNRRRWKPRALAQMLARFPRLCELHYEPWREWTDVEQEFKDEEVLLLIFDSDMAHLHLLKYFASSGLGNLTIFENFHQQYAESFIHDLNSLRTPSSVLGRMLLEVSLSLESLSASFMVDACDFFNRHDPSQKCSNLTSLVLTSQLLAPDENSASITDMLRLREFSNGLFP